MTKTVSVAARLTNFAKQVQVAPVKVPGFDGALYVREMSGVDRERYELGITSGAQDKGHVRAMLVACTLCDEQGKLLFGPDQVAEIASWKVRVLIPLAEKAAELSAITESDIQELEGNS
ncbi:MAG: hypothetical protein ABF271_02250 [Abyssibacter sp.]|uniref:hypothetical protein n=1 Tax=Abyssibacter sp. TaxID=2320200 RepID=UPI00321AA3D0